MLPKENKTLKRKKEQIEPEMKKMKCENDDLRSELSVSMSQIYIRVMRMKKKVKM